MDGCPPRARGTAGNPSTEQAIGWNPNDIGGGKTAGARRAENSMTGDAAAFRAQTAGRMATPHGGDHSLRRASTKNKLRAARI